jgi:hypothetical protein
MAKRPTRPRDPNQLAKLVTDMGTGEAVNDSHVTPSKRAVGGRKGGPARTAKLGAIERRDIARLAANARWKKS